MDQNQEKINPDILNEVPEAEVRLLEPELLALVGGGDEGSGLVRVPK